MKNPFIVRVALENMHQEISMALSPETIAREVNAAIGSALDGFDFEREVKVQSDAIIRESVKKILAGRIIRDDKLAQMIANRIDAAIDAGMGGDL